MDARHKLNQVTTVAVLVVVSVLCERAGVWWSFVPLAVGLLWLLERFRWIRPDRPPRRRRK